MEALLFSLTGFMCTLYKCSILFGI